MTRPGKTRGRAPGKLILTGEHAVVYGQPALVAAVDRFAECNIQHIEAKTITLELPQLSLKETLTHEELRLKTAKLSDRHESFLRGDIEISSVAPGTCDGLWRAIALLVEDLSPPKGLYIQLRTDIPIGCGMGSSAATAVAIIQTLATHLEKDATTEQLYAWAMEAEKLHHGQPSGADPYTSLHGGLLRFQQGQARAMSPLTTPLQLVNTGTPRSSTGQCVSHVREAVPPHAPIWESFAVVEAAMEKALVTHDSASLASLLRKNHRLLCQIGVVPEETQTFIGAIEQDGGAAKVCGAGAVDGAQSGIVWVLSATPPLAICEEFGYTITEVRGEACGAHIV